MADYPLPKFYFKVDWGGTQIGFTEVSGLDVETEPITFRSGNSKKFSKTQQPGLQKYSNITLKRGTFKSNDDFYKWWKETVKFEEGNSTGSVYRRAITISLLDETGADVVIWKVQNAWPIKVQSTDLKSDGNDIAIESMELVHEGLEIEFK